MSSFADAATSPMTLTTTSSNKGSSITTTSRVPSPISDLPQGKIEKLQRKLNRTDKKFKEFDPQKYERDKSRVVRSPQSEVVQLSKTSADAFKLPRELTALSKQQVDFTEMEEIRLNGPKSTETRQSRKTETPRDSSPSKLRALSPSKIREMRESNLSRSKTRYLDSSLSYKSDSALMESPIFRRSHGSEIGRKPWDAPMTQLEERQYKHHVPKQTHRRVKQKQTTDSNFAVGYIHYAIASQFTYMYLCFGFRITSLYFISYNSHKLNLL